MSESHVVHADDVPAMEGPAHGERFASRIRSLGRAAGSKALGCNLIEVQPGQTAFPFHAHIGTEEAIFVLDGTGRLRLGDAEFEVRAGSYVAMPPDKDLPHQLIATGDQTLRYLCFSNKCDPEIVLYPDSDKAMMAGGGGWPPPVRYIFADPQSKQSGYFDGEPTDKG